jgi:hypothetical protein
MARGSLTEVQSHLALVIELGFITTEICIFSKTWGKLAPLQME